MTTTMLINRIKCSSILAKTGIALADYTINPFRGCGHGCLYCYAGKSKQALKKNLPWGSYLDIKNGAAEILDRELSALPPGKSIKVLLGSLTEPFQMPEEAHKTTGEILSVLSRHRIETVILTRSPLILNYSHILREGQYTVYVTLNSENIRAFFEQGTPSLKDKAAILKELPDNVRKTAYVSPFFPLLTDLDEILPHIEGVNAPVLIEVYNFLMGDNSRLFEKIPVNLREGLADIFKDEANYSSYIEKLGRELKNKLAGRDFKLFAPEFKKHWSESGSFYTS